LDTAEAAVRVLEDDPRCNAATGAVPNSEGLIELDATVMQGAELVAGGVAALSPFPHPVSIARAVAVEGRHVLYVGDGARQFALRAGFDEASIDQLRAGSGDGGDDQRAGETVGAVACDAFGNVAAATSTGGRRGQAPGRVGDSPVPGAGTYADDTAGAASATGDGEAILRACLTSRAVAELRVGQSEPQQAADHAVAFLTDRLSATSGLLVVDPHGVVGAAFSTAAMPHASASPGKPR
jgi:beta-aspartyl-peptidase (threonine type)